MRKWWIALYWVLGCLSAEATVVVFDWGDVIASKGDSTARFFVCKTLGLSDKEYRRVDQERKKAALAGQASSAFWRQWAQLKGIALPKTWEGEYKEALKTSLGVDPAMCMLIDLLKEKQIQVGLLSNIGEEKAGRIRESGLYDPFDPCLLSCEMGVKKPDLQAYRILLNALHVPPEEVVFIDNKSKNITAAKKLGIDGIVFHSAKQIRQELQKRQVL